jgi:DNA-directed RNA polymerase subunit beta
MLFKEKNSSHLLGRKYFTKKQEVIPLPNLIEIQQNSYKRFLDEGLKELLDEISPIEDFTGENLALRFTGYMLDEPKLDELQAKARNASFEAAIRAQVELLNKKTQEIKEQEVYLGELPLMTDRGTFIINGIERVVVSQLIRSPGVFYYAEIKGDQKFF